MILYFIPAGSPAKPPEHCSTERKISEGLGGPEGLYGAIFTDGSGKTGFYPDQQTWIKVEDGAYWLGVDRDPVVPTTLERRELIGGHFVTLSDGNKWLIPVARMFPAGTKLPESLILGPDDALVSEILPEFAAISKDGARALRALSGEDDLPMAEGWEIAVRALAVNYNLGRQEVSVLKLLTTQNVTEILKALVDYPEILAAAKKKQTEDDNMSDGSEV